ncbi:MAG: YaaC family protein [Anaerocolumna sp.]
MFKELCINNKPCELMKATKNPKYGNRTILTESSWEYVALYLKRQSTSGSGDALFYWEQAHSFYLASLSLPDSARPLTSYYCILNASKALLRFKGIDNQKLNNHGISTVRANDDTTNLKEANTAVKGSGVLTELGKYFNCQLKPGHYSILDLLYNIPCVHRAYCITFSKPEIFIPISHPVIVKKEGSKESWLKFGIDGRYANAKSLKSVSHKFEHDIGVTTDYVMRMKKRFNWDIHEPIDRRKEKLEKYHEKVRHYVHYIYGESRLWYIKKDVAGNEELAEVTSAVFIFSVFHWLSELVRYNPKLFQKYMKSKQNWLIHEFINNALNQFVDELSCEITGEDIMCTGYRK